MTTFLIVDDHPAFREQARALLETDGLHVIGEADAGATAIDAVDLLRPDVVLLDIGLADMDGFAVADRLAAGSRPPRVVLISSREASTYGPRIGASGAAGFVQKDDLSTASLLALLGPPSSST